MFTFDDIDYENYTYNPDTKRMVSKFGKPMKLFKDNEGRKYYNLYLNRVCKKFYID